MSKHVIVKVRLLITFVLKMTCVVFALLQQSNAQEFHTFAKPHHEIRSHVGKVGLFGFDLTYLLLRCVFVNVCGRWAIVVVVVVVVFMALMSMVVIGTHQGSR